MTMKTEKIVELAMRAGFLDEDDIRMNIQYTCVDADLERLASMIEEEVRRKFMEEMVNLN